MIIQNIIKKNLIISNNHYLLKKWKNINGPICFKVPEWINKPLGKYYLIFSDHKGEFLRLAYTNKIYSKWKISKIKILDVKKYKNIFYDHIASPEIYLDKKNKTICLYFHSRSFIHGREQKTFVAVSKNGIDYKIKNKFPVAPFYFRIFKHQNFYYGLSKGGDLLKSKDKFNKFKYIKNIFNRENYKDRYHNRDGSVRHLSIVYRKTYLEVFYTRIGDKPERIFRGILKFSNNIDNWNVKLIKEILRPTKNFEGVNIKLKNSKSGASIQDENALRDPYILNDKSDNYLFYSVKGEKGIAVSKIIYE